MSDPWAWGSKVFEPCSPVPTIKFTALGIDAEAVGRLIDNAKWHGLKEQRAMEEQTYIVRNSGYTQAALDPDLSDMVQAAKDWIPSNVDTLVGSGLSGTLVVPHLGRALGLHWGIVRKPQDENGSHCCEMYEGVMGRKWALVDDFVSSGATVARVLAQVDEEFGADKVHWRPAWFTEFQGVFSYSRRDTAESWLDLFDLQGWGQIARALDKVNAARHLTAAPEAPEGESPQAGHQGAESEAPQPPY